MAESGPPGGRRRLRPETMTEPASRYRSRALVLTGCLILLLGAIVVRLAYLQIVRHDHFARLAERQYSKTIPLRPERGPILDRNGYALAVNAPVESVYALPGKIADRAAVAGLAGPAPRRAAAGHRAAPGQRPPVRLGQGQGAAGRGRGHPGAAAAGDRHRSRGAPVLSEPRAGGPDSRVRRAGRPGPRGRRAGPRQVPGRRDGTGARRAGCPRPRDDRAADDPQGAHAGDRPRPHHRRDRAVPRRAGAGGRVARHRRQGRDGPRHGSPHGRDPGDGDPPDLQPQRVPGRHRRPVAEPRGDGPLRARVDVQGHPRRRRARGRSREAGRPLLRRAGRHHDRQPDDSRLEEVRLADVPAGPPELLERGLHQGGPPAGSGAVLPAHLGVRLREPHGRRPPRGEPRAAPGARPLVRALPGEHLDRPGGVGDRGPDARGVRRHRQRRPADAAAHRPRRARSETAGKCGGRSPRPCGR